MNYDCEEWLGAVVREETDEYGPNWKKDARFREKIANPEKYEKKKENFQESKKKIP